MPISNSLFIVALKSKLREAEKIICIMVGTSFKLLIQPFTSVSKSWNNYIFTELHGQFKAKYLQVGRNSYNHWNWSSCHNICFVIYIYESIGMLVTTQ